MHAAAALGTDQAGGSKRMSTADSQSRVEPDVTSGASAAALSREAAVWLDGDVLACACPECAAPMSIRLWLAVADCWRCGTSIELTEEQEREAMRLLEQREAGQPSALPSARPDALPIAKPTRPRPPPARVLPATPPPTPQRQVASPASRFKEQLRAADELGAVDLLWRAVFRDFYAWLASLVVHLVLLILLAILLVGGPKEEKPALEIVLSTRAGDVRKEGGRKGPLQTDPIEFDKPGQEEEKKEGADDKPQEPMPEEQPEHKPDPGQKRGNDPTKPLRPSGTSTAPAVNPGMIAGRSNTSRRELVQSEGGTSASEAAVARGLRWIAEHQNDNGSWSLDRFSKTGECKGRCGHPGYHTDMAGTALALLPFLGAGQTHEQGQYRNAVDAGLRWLVNEQQPNGDLPSPFRNTHMYAHGQGSIVLCEAYALTRDSWLREPAQRSIDFIVEAQHAAGGWRYQPGERGDTSVVGWQLMALRSAQMAGLDVPADVLQRAMRYLDDAQTDSAGGRYAYMPGNSATHVMTAEALLCRQYAGWPQNHPGLVDGVRYLLQSHLPRAKDKRTHNLYYIYYATQVMHHMGGTPWEDWNYRVRDLLVDTQETKGHAAGSWTPRVGHDEAGGRLYQTALAVCTLEVYYRHLPLYRQGAVE